MLDVPVGLLEEEMENGGVRLNIKRHEVTVDGKPVVLTLKKFELLERLMRNKNIVLTRDQLLEISGGYISDGERDGGCAYPNPATEVGG